MLSTITDSPTTRSLDPGGTTPYAPTWQPAKYSRAPKPTGGFALLPLEDIVLPWLAHEQGRITPLALRGYLACIEMQERRCQVTPETSLCYTTEELRRLLGAAVRPSGAAAVRQILCDTGLVAWPEEGHQLTLCPQGCAVPWYDPKRYAALLAAIHPSVRQVPLPRRLVTWLAHEGAPGLIATVFGVACRALRYRDHCVIAGGSLVPAWVAATFQVARRTAAYWLHHLQTLDWIAPIATPPAHRRAYGPWLAVNLRWAAPAGPHPDKNLANVASRGRTNLASGHQNLANAAAIPPSLLPERSNSCPAPPCQDGNPFQETSPLQHHNNLRTHTTDGVCLARQETLPPDPATQYACLPAEAQATLYHEAETRLLAQYDRAFVIKPVILEEVYTAIQPTNLLPVRGEPAAPVMPSADRPHAWVERHQAPLAAGTTASSTHRTPAQDLAAVSPTVSPPLVPCLHAITTTDLADLPRLRALWQQAQARGWVGGSDADWLTIVTAAQHALRVGDNPGGLFIAVLRQRAWHLLTQADDDAARQVLRAARGPLTASERAILHQVFGQPAAGPPGLPVPPLSHAAQCAREALRLCQSARWSGDPFTVIKAAEPAWTRIRWDAALAELEQWQLLQQVANARQQRALADTGDDGKQTAAAADDGVAQFHATIEADMQAPRGAGQRAVARLGLLGPSHPPPKMGGQRCAVGSAEAPPTAQPVSAASGGPVSAVAETPSPLGCPRHRLGCQATWS